MSDHTATPENLFQANIKLAEDAIAAGDFASAADAFIKNRYRPVSVISTITKTDPTAHVLSGLVATTIRKWATYVISSLTAEKVKARATHMADCLRAASYCHPALFYVEKQRLFAKIAEVGAVVPQHLSQVAGEVEAYYKKRHTTNDWANAGFIVKSSDKHKIVYALDGVAEVCIYAPHKQPTPVIEKRCEPEAKKREGHGVNAFGISLRRAKEALSEKKFANAAAIIKEMGFAPFFMITSLCAEEPESGNPNSVTGRFLVEFIHHVLTTDWDEQNAVNVLHAFARQNVNSYFIAKGEISSKMNELGVQFSPTNKVFLSSLEDLMKEQFTASDWELAGFLLEKRDVRQSVWVHHMTRERVIVVYPKMSLPK